MTTGPTLRTPRSRALGLGSAHHGVGHFIVEHVTAVMLVPLGLWGASKPSDGLGMDVPNYS